MFSPRVVEIDSEFQVPVIHTADAVATFSLEKSFPEELTNFSCSTKALRPLRNAMKEPKAATGNEATDGEDEDDENAGSGSEDDSEEKTKEYPQDYSRLTEVRAQQLLKEKESEMIKLSGLVDKAIKVLEQLKAVNDEWMQLEQKRVQRALQHYTKHTETVIVSTQLP